MTRRQRINGRLLLVGKPGPPVHWEPTQEEIRAECQRIQATWTDWERYRRSCGRDRQAAIACGRPVVPTPDEAIQEAFSE